MNRNLSVLVLSLVAVGFSDVVMGAPPEKDAYVVEEQWQLVLNGPLDAEASPQFFTAFPLGNDRYFVTTWNFWDVPEYYAGGVQLQLWEGDECVDDLSLATGPLNVDGDTLTWTHVYKIQQNDVEMKITGISSQAWGQNINTSSLTLQGANVSTFNTYDPMNSMDASGISLGAHRVAWFGITEVRLYDDKGKKIQTDTTQRTLWIDPDPDN